MSELTHFGEHGPNTFSTSSIPILEKKRHGNNDRMIMSVDLSYEPERDMNCLDILAGVVSRCSSSEVDQKPLACAVEISRSSSDKSDPANPQEHRVSCHRCGNIRKRKIVCERPQVILAPSIDANVGNHTYHSAEGSSKFPTLTSSQQ